MANISDPVLVDISGLGSLDQAIERISVPKVFDELVGQIMRSYIDRGGEWSPMFAFLGSAASRGRALHEAVVREITASNPPASITLLRQLAETVAMAFYVSDHPTYVTVLATSPSAKPKGAPNRKSMQALINHMDRNYSHQFGTVYSEMCEMTHFGTSALWSSHRITDVPGGAPRVSWNSAPTWKYERDGLVCCALLLELTGAMKGALVKLGETLITDLSDQDTGASSASTPEVPSPGVRGK